MYKSVIHRKYKGGILLLAVFISVVISVFCGAIVLMFYYLNSNAERFLISDSLKDEAESAIILALNDIKNSEDNYVLYDGFQTTIKTAPWGIYTMLHVKSKFKLDSIVKVVLVGNKRESFENNALILSNPTQDLHVCGNVVIKGLCHLPKTTIKKVTIEGRNPEKIEISNDKIISSIVSFPDVSEEAFYPIKYFFYQY